MTTRRDMLIGTATAGLASVAPRIAIAATAALDDGLCRHVDPFIGTGGHGHVFPGATVPFGMIQLSPDTDNARWDACSGYHHDDNSILGFSHSHLSGTGVGDMMDVLVVPRTGAVALDPGTLERPQGSYRSRFDHADERASPGYYRVHLKDSRIDAELTATARAGLHRYRFPAGSGEGHLLIDFRHGAREEPDAASIGYDPARMTAVTEAALRVVGDDMIVGTRRVHQWADGRVIHFAMKLSRPFARAQLYGNDRAVPGRSIDGAALKCVLAYPDAGAAPLLVKVALSAVDVDGAVRNLEAELPGWDFDAVHAAARAQWERELRRIAIAGASDTDLRIFYTACYHAMLAPTLFSDVDGRYRGMDSAVHGLAAGSNNYSTYSLWDTYRALHPLFTLVQPDRTADLVHCLVRMAGESPLGPPIWPLQGIETRCMIGWHSAVVIAEACAKRVPGVDVAAAWPIFRKRAFEDRVSGLVPYRALGFIPSDKVAEAASKTLEYAYDDWAMATIADAAGARDDARLLRDRSRNYRNLFDPQTRFMRPRLADGHWAAPFDPTSLGHDVTHWRDFTECNAWQATFLNQHDVHGYIALFGGDRAFEAKLDALFAADSAIAGPSVPDISGMVGQYAHGNEPSHHVAYLYAYAGVPWKTQARVRMLLAGQYRAAPDGVAGNEDCGQMSAWYVMSAMGLYAVDPVSAVYVFGSPLFARVQIDTGAPAPLVIEAPATSATNIYIQSVTWNGEDWPRSWIDHAALVRGGRLVFQMGASPNRQFGAAIAARPPSFGQMPTA